MSGNPRQRPVDRQPLRIDPVNELASVMILNRKAITRIIDQQIGQCIGSYPEGCCVQKRCRRRRRPKAAENEFPNAGVADNFKERRRRQTGEKRALEHDLLRMGATPGGEGAIHAARSERMGNRETELTCQFDDPRNPVKHRCRPITGFTVQTIEVVNDQERSALPEQARMRCKHDWAMTRENRHRQLQDAMRRSGDVTGRSAERSRIPGRDHSPSGRMIT